MESSAPIRIPSHEHGISLKDISRAAREVVSQLQKAGFEAYLVGGSVRDLLLGHHPKDFDVATNALPEQIKPLFRRCFLIGRRFRLAHVYVDNHIIEVATFRGFTPTAEKTTHENAHHTHETTGLVLRDNIYGTLAEDAWRRDFSVNALYYDPEQGDIIDYTDGFKDLQAKRLRIIGEPEQRYREDPVRMLRAVRFMGKLGFQLDPHSEKPISQLAHLLAQVPGARLFEEFNKLFTHGHAFSNYQLLKTYGLFSVLLPKTKEIKTEAVDPRIAESLIESALKNTDVRVKQQKPVTPAFLLAAFLWPVYIANIAHYQKHHKQSFYIAALTAANDTLSSQSQHMSIPKRLALFIRETWQMQQRLTHLRRRQIYRVFHHPRFRAAYDFLVLRSAAGEPYEAIVHWWTAFQEAKEDKRHELLEHLPPLSDPKI